MVFAALPPEVNSGLMYSGPGAGPLLTAAAAWDGLAAELQSAATGYQTVVSELTEQAWHGPSSAAMAAAAGPYLAWLATSATRAEKIATQAKWAAAAYEAAFVMTVPPSAVAANRAQLAALVATNFLGQNTPVIAATEVQYGEMWAQDVAAMNGYAAAAATAVDADSFDPPPQTTNPAGSLGQAAAADQSLGSSAGSNVQPVSQLSTALQELASPARGVNPAAGLALLESDPVGGFDLLGIIADEAGLGVALPLSIASIFISSGAWYYAEVDSLEIIEAQDVLSGGQSTILDAIEELGSAWLAAGAPVSPGLGQAVSVGNLSVPPSWATAAPEIHTAAYTAPVAGTAPGGIGTAFGQMALAGMAGSALAGAIGRGRGESARPAPAEQSESAPPPAEPARQPEPPQRPPVVSVAEMAADIRELGELRDSGLLTEAEFSEQKRRLLGR